MKWFWQVILYITGAVAVFFSTYIWSWIKYSMIWSFSYEWKQRTLSPIWNKVGIVEIVGGAETGKTLLIILLTKYLRGRKWNNVPNIVPGCQELNLSTLRNIWMGDYKDGLVGSNNVLLIDESWSFFSQKNCQANNFSHDILKDLFLFLSETSKTGFKIFYVRKQGAEPYKAFNLLSANKTAQIRVLGVRKYCKWFDKECFYLDFEFITSEQFNTPETKTSKKKKPLKRYELKKGHFFKQSTAPWFGKNIISLPFGKDELDLYDKTWNLDSAYKRQREMSIMDKLAADALIETCRYKQSRTQRLIEENEILNVWRKNSGRTKEMIIKGWELAEEKGLWKPASERLNEEVKEVKKSFESGKINHDEYQERIGYIFQKRLKLAIKMEKVAAKNNQSQGMDEVPIKEKTKNIKKPKTGKE